MTVVTGDATVDGMICVTEHLARERSDNQLDGHDWVIAKPKMYFCTITVYRLERARVNIEVGGGHNNIRTREGRRNYL